MIQRFHFNGAARFFLHLPRWTGENPFVGFLLLLCVALLISSLVFYRYVFAARFEDVGGEVAQTRLEQQKLQQVIQTWQEREVKFSEADPGLIRNIFARQEKVLEEVEN